MSAFVWVINNFSLKRGFRRKCTGYRSPHEVAAELPGRQLDGISQRWILLDAREGVLGDLAIRSYCRFYDFSVWELTSSDNIEIRLPLSLSVVVLNDADALQQPIGPAELP